MLLNKTALYASMKRISFIKLIILFIVMALLSMWLYPLFLSVFTSLKSESEVIHGPLSLPMHPSLDAFVKVWKLIEGFRVLKFYVVK